MMGSHPGRVEARAADPGDRPVPGRWLPRATRGGVLAAAGGAAGLARGPALRAAEPELIVRNTRPLALETPVTALDSWLTPNRLFFVRSHLGTPAVDPSTWAL